jgi:hypothetical protein
MPRPSLFLPLLALAACAMLEDVSEHPVDGPVERLVLDVAGADVTVVGQVTADSVVTVTRRWQERRPKVEITLDQGTLTVRGGCADSPHLGTCAVDLAVGLPADASVLGSSGSGDLQLDGLRGDVDVDIGSGDVDLLDLSGPVRVRSGSGDIIGEALTGDTIDVEVHSGDVGLTVRGPIRSARLVSGSGDLDLAVPAGRYAVRASSTSGDLDIEGIVPDPDATASLHVDTRSGDVRLVGR